MKEMVRVEVKRVLNRKILLVLLAFILMYSIYSCYMDYSNYTVYDPSGHVRVSAAENLSEYKKAGEQMLDADKLLEIVKRRGNGGYISYLAPARLILADYTEKNLADVSSEDIRMFYNRRLENAENHYRKTRIFSERQINYLVQKAGQLSTPLKTGYAEGWRNLNHDAADFIVIVLAIVSVVLISVFGKNPKADIRQICLSTRYGKKPLIQAEILSGFVISTGFYLVSLLIFTLPKLIVFGVQGHHLPIQSDVQYFYSAYNITHLQQYLLNISIGFFAVFLMASMVLILTSLTEQVLSGAVLVVFFWVLMIVLPGNLLTDFGFAHYSINFLPYSMTRFSNYYKLNDLYPLFGGFIPSAYWVMLIDGGLSFALLSITYFINTCKLPSPATGHIKKRFRIWANRRHA